MKGNSTDFKRTCSANITLQGDIGGPLTNTAGELVGITSNGLGCLSKQKPGLYTQVSHFLEWMATNVGRHEANQLLHHQP
jgi:secreted trypsin-like serine protease